MLRSLLTFALLLTTLSGCVSSSKTQALWPSGKNAECQDTLASFYKKIESKRTFALPYSQDERFPYLAFDRFSTSLVGEITGENQKSQWLSYVMQLGKQQLDTALKLSDTKESSAISLQQCQALLAQQTMGNSVFWQTFTSNPPVIETAYQHWKRVVGVYPISSLVAAGQIEDEQAHIMSGFNRPLDSVFRYGVSGKNHVDISAVFDRARSVSELDWPVFNAKETEQLLDAFSPVISVETRSRDDLPGKLAVDTTTPTLYRGITYTRFQGDILTQLNYVVWFPARTEKGYFDPYGGKFDAINLRLTLDNEGQPLVFDSIHQCGCFHMVYALSPTLDFIASDGERPIAVKLPEPTANSRLHVALSTAEHMIVKVEFTDNIQADIDLKPLPLTQLSVLQSPDGKYKSPFNRHGIITDSARGERWFLWPFGVRSPGAMRQQGQHAIAFIGERHFDEAFLFEGILKQE